MALDAYPHTAGGDGPFFHEMIEAVRASLFRDHELPLWNPYQCGGIPLWDNPQGLAASPVLWALLPFFDTTHLIPIWIIVHCAMGFLCMWTLARVELRMSIEASLLAAGVWAFCGAHNQHFNGGQINWSGFLYFPLAIFFWRRAEHDLRMAVGLGVLIAWMMHEAGIYPLSHLSLLLAVETLTRVWPAARLKMIVRAGVVAVVVGLALGAPRFLPVIDQLRSHSRDLHVEADAMQWSTLKEIFLDRVHSRHVLGQEYVWPEFGAYVGPFALGLAFLGVVTVRRGQAWLLVLFAWVFLLMMGHKWPWAPWHVLKEHVFPFKQMRVPSRFNTSVSLFIAVFAGLAIDRMATLVRSISRSGRASDTLRIGLIVVGFCGVGDIMNAGFIWNEGNGFNHAPADTSVVPSPRFYLDGPGLADFIDEPRQNRGRTACWEEWAFERDAPVWSGDVEQAKAADDAAQVSSVHRTQNTFVIDVVASRPARLLLNSAYDKGWHASVGEAVRQGHLLAVDVPAGQHHLVVDYWPRGLSAGLALASMAMVGALAFSAWSATRRA
jgi:hypothetical protein